MTKWAFHRVWADVEDNAHKRIVARLSYRVFCRVEDVLNGPVVSAFEIIHVIAPSVSVSGRGSQPGTED